jgi:hypothetical protein
MVYADREGNTKEMIPKVQTVIPQTDKLTVIGTVASFGRGQISRIKANWSYVTIPVRLL